MNKVKTYIGNSKIEGIGLFAAEFIPKDTVIWEFSGLDQKFSQEQIKQLSLSDIEFKYFNRYEFGKNGEYIFCSDDAKYCNHSDTPNTYGYEKQYAIRDIHVGEEITCNYAEINSEFNTSEFNYLKSYKQ